MENFLDNYYIQGLPTLKNHVKGRYKISSQKKKGWQIGKTKTIPKDLFENRVRRDDSNVKDIINGLFLGCIQNKAILISMLVGRHDMGVWKYWTF